MNRYIRQSLITGLIATLGLTGNISAQEQQPPADTPGKERAAQSHKKIDELLDAWDRLLRDSKVIHLRMSAERVTTVKDNSDSEAAPVVKSQIRVRAEAVMKRDALWLCVWDDEPKDEPNAPALTIRFESGQVHERMWYPGVKKYRAKTYPAPTAFGAEDSEYAQACQVGTLLQTWLGENELWTDMIATLRSSHLSSETESIAGNDCHVIIQAGEPRMSQASGGLYQRDDKFYVTSHGELKRWETIVTTTKDKTETSIRQLRDYEMTFSQDESTVVPPSPSSAGAQKNE